jgi:hypothetical protein
MAKSSRLRGPTIGRDPALAAQVAKVAAERAATERQNAKSPPAESPLG